MQTEIHGLNEAIDKLNEIDRRIQDTSPAMHQATLLVTGAARRNAPVDRGVTRASITPSVESRGSETVGVVGSNLVSALMMEKGTRPYWPLMIAIETWARRHGIAAFLVARAIARRGLKARRFLQGALEDNQRRIVRIFNDYVRKVIR